MSTLPAVREKCFTVTSDSGVYSRGSLVAQATKFCVVVPNIFSTVVAVFSLYKKWVSFHMHQAEGTR